MKINKKTMIHLIICSVIVFAVMLFFVTLNYIDLSLIRKIYLPIYIIVILAILFRQYVFGYIFTAALGLGLIIEYITHLSQEHPSMAGAFLNTLIIFLGFITGVIAQILVHKIKNKETI